MTHVMQDKEIVIEAEEDVQELSSAKCTKCCNKCNLCLKPILAEEHPLPADPSFLQKCHYALLCPPHGLIGATIFVVVFGFLFWAVLVSLTGKEALPGGNLFSLTVLFICCWCGGNLIKFIRLPPLLGMLLVGGILGSVPGATIAKDITPAWASSARQIALAIILIRAGLGLDPAALRRLSFVVLRLAFSPCLAETVANAVAAHLILGFPWQWGFMLGFVIAAVSPAVVVPSLLSLAERGYGLDKGVPTLVIAASSIDDVLAITGFGVLLGITFSSGNIVWTLFKGPVEAVVGVAYGTVGGIILWYIPQKSSKHRLLFRSAMLLCGGLLAVFGSIAVDWSGAGPLGCLTMPFVAALRWRSELPKNQSNPVEEVVAVLWMLFQPLLFGLIGAAVKISTLSASSVGLGLAVLGIGLCVRLIVSFLSVLRTNLTMKERLFIPIAWLPKATVQAAIGAVALDMAMERENDEWIELGEEALRLAVLAILITAPIGSVAIALSGPRLLKHTSHIITLEVARPKSSKEIEITQNDQAADEKLLSKMEMEL